MADSINTGVSGFGTQGAGEGIPGQVPGSVTTPNALYNYLKSTIESSQQVPEEYLMLLMMVSGIPILTPPQEAGATAKGGDAGTIQGIQSEQQKRDIMSSILDAWLQNVRQIAEDTKKDDIRHHEKAVQGSGAMSSVEYNEYLQKSSSARRAEEIASQNPLAAQFMAMYNQWMTPSIDGVSNGSYPDPSFIAGCLVSCPAAVISAIGSDSDITGFQLSVGPVADAVAAGGSMSGLPGDAQAAAAMIAALLYNGSMLKATEETVAAANASGKTPQTLEFAKDFAKQIMAIVTAPTEGEVNPQRAAQNNLIRLTLSAMALNLLYRQAYGGMSGVDMKSLLMGGDTSDIPDPEVREMVDSLVSMIKSYLPKDPVERQKAIETLCDQVDDNESADSMLETTNLCAGLLNTKGINTSRLNASSG